MWLPLGALLQARDVCRLLATLGDRRMAPVAPPLLQSLLSRLLQHVEAKGPGVLHLSTLGLAVKAAGRIARTYEDAAPAAVALLNIVLHDVKTNGPAAYLGPTLANLLMQAWELELERVRGRWGRDTPDGVGPDYQPDGLLPIGGAGQMRISCDWPSTPL